MTDKPAQTDIATLETKVVRPNRIKRAVIPDNDINRYLKRHHLRRTRATVIRARAAIRKRREKAAAKIGKEISGSESAGEWQVIYGKQRVGGVYTFIHTINNNQNLLLVITIAGHEVEAVDKIFLDNEELVFGSGFPGTATAPDKYSGKVYGQINLGSDAQTALSQLVADAPTKWTSDHKQSGRCHIYLKLTWDANSFPNGLPEIFFEVRGKKLYDPRSATTVYSNNPALCLSDYLMDTKYGLGIAQADIDTTTWIAAANKCDESVSLVAGGTEARYTCNGAFGVDESPKNVIEQILTSMHGILVKVSNKWKIYAGAYIAPSITLTEDDIVGEIQVQTRISKRDSFNAVKGTYTSPENNWEETDFPVIKNSFYITEDNGETIFEDISLPFTTSGATAQRLAKIELEKVRQGIIVDLTAKLKAYQAEPPETLQLTLSRFGWTNKVFEIQQSQLVIEEDGNGAPITAVRLNLRETASGVYDWNNGEETRVDLAPNTTLPNPFTVETIVGLTLSSGTSELYIRADGTVFSRIKASWTALTDFFVTSGGVIEVQYKQSTAVDWSNATPVPGNTTFTHILDVQDGTSYDVRVRAVSATGVQGTYTTETGHIVIGKTAPPSDVQGLVGTITQFGVELDWDAVPDLDVLSYVVKIGDLNQSWTDSQFLAEVSTTNFFIGLQTVGTYKFQIKAKDTSNNESTNPTILSVTIGGPSQVTITSTINGPNVVLNWTDSVGLFAISEYDIKYGDTYGSATLIASVTGTTFTQKVLWGGNRRFWVVARDVAGNVGTENYIDVGIVVPTQIQALTSEVIDNNVLLKWTAPVSASLPIEHYKVYKGATFSGATLIGQADVTFSAVFEIVGGTYTYWITPIDSAGNVGPETGVTAIVSQPPDFIITDDILLDLDSGTYVNCIIDHNLAGDDILVAPVLNTQSYENHFISNGYTTPQDQVSAGNTYFIQPAATFGYWQKIIDYGSILPATLIKLNFVKTNIVGAVATNTKIGYSADNVSFVEQSGVTQLYGINFRYVRIRLEFGTIPWNTGEPAGLLLALTNP